MNRLESIFPLIMMCLLFGGFAAIIPVVTLGWPIWVIFIFIGAGMGVFLTWQIGFSDRKRKATWRQFASEMGAELTGSESEVMRFQIKLWTVCIEMVSSGEEVLNIETTARAEYSANDGFEFQAYRNLRTDRGLQNIKIGSPEFDQQFVLQGSEPTKIKALFSDPAIRRLMLELPRVHLGARSSSAGGCNFVLGFKNQNGDRIENIEELRSLSELYGLMLERLSSGGEGK